MDFTALEFILCGMVLLAAGFSYNFGYNFGVGLGAETTVDLLAQEGVLSRFVNEDGEIEFCSAGVMNNICPKCGFHDGDNCEEHA
jgi:hypothetical protein